MEDLCRQGARRAEEPKEPGRGGREPDGTNLSVSLFPDFLINVKES